jgi:hypothetical protein
MARPQRRYFWWGALAQKSKRLARENKYAGRIPATMDARFCTAIAFIKIRAQLIAPIAVWTLRTHFAGTRVRFVTPISAANLRVVPAALPVV